MKKSKRFFLTGSIQPVIFNRFIKDSADSFGVAGFVRTLEDGRTEIFIEGNIDSVEKITPLCRTGPQHSIIRKVEEKEERFQSFRDFKILNF
ncbi:acylphosphatase [Candidatus Parvarchaeota archaeon]|jgi:acylphosphatase|nr:MAG: acylphosphatase [Candidatus Parvarchaeota archaeon]HIG51812.1 acylphosphatase [Candidatus Pacearchaeota archaeon]